jgi:hypothetical protein
VGDDFLKDVVAAKNMKMRSIWAVGLVREKLFAQTDIQEPTMDVGEFMKKVSSQAVVSLGIGADDYLASSLTGEFVDAVAENFSDIAKILLDWHGECNFEENQTSLAVTSESGMPTDKSLTKEPSLPVLAVANKNEDSGVDFVVPRTFRIVREDCSIDVPAPLKNRGERTMKDVMSMAQLDKSSGVFAFTAEDVSSMQEGKKVLMVRIGNTDLELAREIFSTMSVEEVLCLTDENPVKLSLFMKAAVDQPSFDLF